MTQLLSQLSNNCNASKDKEARPRDVPGIEQVLPVLIDKGVACKGMTISEKHLQTAWHLRAGRWSDMKCQGGEAARRKISAPPAKGACCKAFGQGNGKAVWPSRVLTFTAALMRIVWLR